MINLKWFIPMVLIALAFLSGMYVSTGKRMRVPPDTILVTDTIIGERNTFLCFSEMTGSFEECHPAMMAEIGKLQSKVWFANE